MGETESGTRRIPVYSEIKQLVKKLVQKNKAGYLLNGLCSGNTLNMRAGAISKNLDISKEAWVLNIESAVSEAFGQHA